MRGSHFISSHMTFESLYMLCVAVVMGYKFTTAFPLLVIVIDSHRDATLSSTLSHVYS